MECSTVSGHEVLWVAEDVDLLSRLVPTSRKWLTKASSAKQLHTPTNIRETMSSTSPIATQIPASKLAKNSKLMRAKQHIDSIQSGDTNKTSKSSKAKIKDLSRPKTSGSIFVGSGLGEWEQQHANPFKSPSPLKCVLLKCVEACIENTWDPWFLSCSLGVKKTSIQLNALCPSMPAASMSTFDQDSISKQEGLD